MSDTILEALAIDMAFRANPSSAANARADGKALFDARLVALDSTGRGAFIKPGCEEAAIAIAGPAIVDVDGMPDRFRRVDARTAQMRARLAADDPHRVALGERIRAIETARPSESTPPDRAQARPAKTTKRTPDEIRAELDALNAQKSKGNDEQFRHARAHQREQLIAELVAQGAA